MTVKSGQAWSGLVVCKDSTGALATPSVGPAGTLYVDGTANGASVTISGSNPYNWTVTLPSLTAGQCVSMYITATIATIATASVVAEDVSDTKWVSDLNDAAAPPSAATIAGAVLDEAKGAHTGHIADIPTSGTGDWTVDEREQIRYRLGVDGDTNEPAATPVFSVSGGTINSVSEAVTLADNGITAAKLADSAIAEIAAAATGGATMQQMRDAMLLAPSSGTPAVGSIDDHLDDLAAALAAATATLTVVSAVDGGEINIYQAVSFSATISGLSIPADWTKVYWTVKQATGQADTDAILQMVETNPGAGTDGLLRLNGAVGTASNGSLTVDQAAGTVVIDLVMTISDDLSLATGLVWSLKVLHPTSASTLLAVGTLNVRGQATAAVA